MHMRSFSLAVGIAAALSACSAEENSDPTDTQDPVTSASLELSSVPSGAQCLQVSGTGTAAFSTSIALTAGASTSAVTIGRIPVGTATINASVYDVACGSTSGVSPSWIADSQSATFRPGVIAKLNITLRANNPVSANVNFVGNIVDLSGGYDASGIVMSDGTTRTAGNWYPIGGQYTFTNSNSNLTGIVELDAPRTYNAHACARNTSGQLLCWGNNTAGELASTVAVGGVLSNPTVIAGISNVTKMALGDHHTCVISNNAVYCWGLNSSGQVGNGTTTNVATPTFISTAAAPDRLVAGSNFTCVNTYAGLSCWGNNASGQLGDGTTTSRSTVVYVTGGVGVVSLAAGNNHACSVHADGTVKCWGANWSGQLGDGTTTQRLTPTLVSGITDAVQVVAGAAHTCVRRQTGTVVCFGDGTYGQIGDGAAQIRMTPTAVPGIAGVSMIAAGGFHTCVVQDNQVVQCWGMDMSGQCADGAIGDNYKPLAASVQ